MKDIIIGVSICISLYSTFYYLHCKNKKENSKNNEEKEKINNNEEKEKINNNEEKENNNDKYTQTDIIDGILKKKDTEIEDILDNIITNVEKENQGKKTTVSFDEDFEVVH